MTNKEQKPEKAKKRRIGCWLFLAIFLALLLLGAIYTPCLLNAKRSAWESRAKATLRAWAETQYAYSNTNGAGAYGTWDDLKDAEYLADGYTKATIIENYTLWTSVDNPSLLIDPELEEFDPTINTFTLVAFPMKIKPRGYLATFAIHEDEVLRVYRPGSGVRAWGEDGDYGAKTWEPIR